MARPALCVPRSSPCVPNGPPTAAQARGRHEKPALRPPAAPTAAAAAAAHTSRRRRRGHHRGKRPGAPVHPGCAPSSCRGVVGTGTEGETAWGPRPGRWGHGRVIPDRDTCPTRPLEHLEDALIPKQRAARTSGAPWKKCPRSLPSTFSRSPATLSSRLVFFPLKLKEVSFGSFLEHFAPAFPDSVLKI